MREYGLPASAAAHILLMGAMIFAMPGAQPLSVAPEIPVEVISSADFTEITKGDKNGDVAAAPSDESSSAADQPKTQPSPQSTPLPPVRQPEQSATADQPPPPPPPKSVKPQTVPVPPKTPATDTAALEKLAQKAADDAAKEKAQKEKAAQEKAAQEKAAQEKADAEEAARKQALINEQKLAERKAAQAKAASDKKAAEQKLAAEKFDRTDLDQVLKKHGSGRNVSAVRPPGTVPSRQPSTHAGTSRDSVSQTGATPAGTADGTAPKLSISDTAMLQNLINQQVRECMSPSFGKDGAKDEARLQLTMNEDGTFAQPPKLLSASRDAVGNMALRAVQGCITTDKPLKFKKELYASWKVFNYVVKPGGF